jgi:hypothetical protein
MVLVVLSLRQSLPDCRGVKAQQLVEKRRLAVIPSLPAASRRSEDLFLFPPFLRKESLFCPKPKKREIPHSEDSVRNDESRVSQQAAVV